VDWYEWGEEALTAAADQDKPILVSIGYSSCHWCHVMERESFEDKDLAALMNEFFICIKVDREERPDVDQVYMDAVQAMGQNGGWPLNVFLTPAQKPFFGGTYFPPRNWAQILRNVHQAFRTQRAALENNSEELAKHIASSGVERFQPADALRKDWEAMYSILHARFDSQYGGIDKSPKFVMPSQWLWLLRFHYLSANPEALRMVELTLDRMSRGGLYDVAGGGFARYSVDNRWFVPHFEKMLYDNAQLITLYSEAFRATGNTEYRRVVEETVAWLNREMTGPRSGLYSALDADSEGVEGKYYVWSKKEIEEALGPAADEFCAAFGVTEAGNWEHGRNILQYTDHPSRIRSLSIEQSLRTLRAIRQGRIRPGLDDKVVTAWTCMGMSAFADAYTAFGEETYLSLAKNHADFVLRNLKEGSRLFRSFKGRRSDTEGFLDDYAFFIRAMTDLYQSTFDESWLNHAEEALTYTLDQFLDPADGFFFYTSSSAPALIARKKEVYDNVIPGSNSVMARNLIVMSELFQREDWKDLAMNMILRLQPVIASEPSYLSNWGIAAMELSEGLIEVVFGGLRRDTLRKDLMAGYVPLCVSVGAPGRLPLAQNRGEGEGTVYVCHNRVCKLPAQTSAEAFAQIRSRHAGS
jgi:hypothetical protein